VTYASPLHITIRSTEDGYYRWELRDGPDGAFEFAGLSPLLERCFEEILRAQWVLAEHVTGEADPVPLAHPHDAPDPAPIAQVQTPSGVVLPLQQDIPSTTHTLGA
jgi:hypothetical protein